MTAKLLIVDDDLNTIQLMNEVLRGSGDLFFATDGASAVRAAHEKKPDIVLLDAEMPEMDGFEVCAALKADPTTTETAIIFVTAHSDFEHESRALDLGAIDYISKPISPPIVRARVRNQLTMKAQADELRRLATTDPLTGLPNRRTFESALEQEWRRARRGRHPLAVIMVDVDHFKNFNDFYGHPAGDVCLQSVAQALHESTHRPGEIVARYGGEEFIILLPDSDLHGATKFGVKLCRAVRGLNIAHADSQTSGFVTASVGVAAFIPDAEMEMRLLVSTADQALYRAKGSGRNRVVGLLPQ